MALPFQMPGEGTQGRELTHEGTAPHRLHAARGQERTNVEGLQAEHTLDCGLFAEMLREKGQELPDVAGIGLHRLRREPALLGERIEPDHHLPAGVVRTGENEIDV